VYFQESELGQLSAQLPDKELSALIAPKKHPQGAIPWLSSSGKFRLMLLKHYSGLSDEKLVDRLNTDWSYQLFCQLELAEGEFIRDKSLVSRVRKELSGIAYQKIQHVLQKHWKDNLPANERKTLLMDATCFESYLRYPTDVKLLFECCQWLNGQLLCLCTHLSRARPRNGFKAQQQQYFAYARQRKKTYRQTLKRRRSLLQLLEKLAGQFQQLLNANQVNWLNEKTYQRLKLIRTVAQQQRSLLSRPSLSLPGRILSLHKPYVRAIVRGKETKPVEFGAKVHLTLSAGLCWVEHLSFDAFHEGKRLKASVYKHQNVFGTCRFVGADRIYATNENRRFVSGNNIQTNFAKKGPVPVSGQQKQVQVLIHKARASQMEGVFGNQKNHYLLHKIKARTQPTEIIWILFGVVTANAVKVAKSPPRLAA
jgi:hypothetical protein